MHRCKHRAPMTATVFDIFQAVRVSKQLHIQRFCYINLIKEVEIHNLCILLRQCIPYIYSKLVSYKKLVDGTSKKGREGEEGWGGGWREQDGEWVIMGPFW